VSGVGEEVKALVAKLSAEDRAEVLSTLRAEWCSCCGTVLNDDGECCE
jgi:hypothetical protein